MWPDVGTRGLKLWNFENINEAVPGPGPLTSRYLITPNLSSIMESFDQGNSIYHSLQVRGEATQLWSFIQCGIYLVQVD